MEIPGYIELQESDYYDGELNEALRYWLSTNGHPLPQLTTAEITTIAPDMPDGTMWYDTDTNEGKILLNGVVTVFAP